jgi:hypothetical protein
MMGGWRAWRWAGVKGVTPIQCADLLLAMVTVSRPSGRVISERQNAEGSGRSRDSGGRIVWWTVRCALPDPHGAACGGPFCFRKVRSQAGSVASSILASWHFARDPDFRRQLVPDAVELGLVRPLYYALHYASELLGTTVPDPVMAEESRVGRPPATVRVAMDPMVCRALLPIFSSPGRRGRESPACASTFGRTGCACRPALGAVPAAQGVGPKFCRGLLSRGSARGSDETYAAVAAPM